MTFRAKLLLAEAPLAIVLALVCVLSVVMISTLSSRSQLILKDNYRSVLAAQRMKEAAERLDDTLVLSLLKDQQKEEAKQAATYRQQFEQELQVQEGNITEPGEQDATQRLRTFWNDYQDKMHRFKALQAPEAAKQFYFTELATAFHSLRTTLEDILAINQDSMVRKSEEARRAATRLNTITVTAALGALLLGLVLSTVLTNRLLRPLSVLSQVTRRIGEGDFQARVNISGKDEIAQLAREFNTMASHLDEYRNSSLGELLHAQESLQAAIDSLPDPVVVFGVNGDIRNVNQAAETILGLHVETVTKDPLQDVDPSVRAVLEQLRTQVLSGNGPFFPKGFEDAIRVATREGDTYLLPRAAPVYEMGGTLIGATVILQEITRLHRFDELKNNLVATVAHEFRTPLTSLRMAIHLCLEQAVGPITEKQADLLHAAREDCERLQAMVDDLLDLSRMEAGRVELHLHAVSPALLVKGAAETHRALAEEQGIQLRMVLPAPDTAVAADPERIAIVLANLVTNALRHTSAGGQITIVARPINHHVRFEVTDTGAGIPPEYQARVFDKFFRVPSAPGGAAGLGLSIVKEIVAEHDGEIGLDSEEGKGSTFWFTLPRTMTNSTEEAVQL